MSQAISISSIQKVGVSISLGFRFSISRSLANIAMGIRVSIVSSISKMSQAISVSSVQKVGISISLGLSLRLSNGNSSQKSNGKCFHHLDVSSTSDQQRMLSTTHLSVFIPAVASLESRL